jgi:hypothetical protein
MKKATPHRIRQTIRTLLLVSGVITLTACSLLTGLQQKASQLFNLATPTPVDPAVAILALPDEEIQAGIQKVVDTYARAYNTNDLELLLSVTDPENLPFKRLVSNRFTDLQESIWASNLNMQYSVQSIKRMPLGFVQAHLLSYETSADDWLFRKYDGKWVLSEPTEAQFGEPTEKETEHFVYSLYPWSNEINEQIISLMERAAQRVEDKLGKLPPEKAKVIILPGYSADPYSDPNSLAYYQTGATGQLDSIVVFCPNSYSFGWYDEQRGWAPDLEDTLTHEYTHMTHQRAFGKAGKLLDWFSEGLAEYVSDSQRYFEIQQALEPDRLIPLVDSVSAINQQDLAHIYLLEKDVSLAYAEAESLIMFIEQKYGGMDAVWAVATTHDKIQNLDEALQSAIGVNLETFNREWRDWLKFELFSN